MTSPALESEGVSFGCMDQSVIKLEEIERKRDERHAVFTESIARQSKLSRNEAACLLSVQSCNPSVNHSEC